MSLTHPVYADLSPARRQLVNLMRDLRYGQIRSVPVVDGEPVLDPLPPIVRSVRLVNVRNTPHRPTKGYRLKPHVIALFAEFDRLGTGQIETIKVQDGLPVHVQVAVEPQPAA
jgi:hypothetical protein